eukprot:TRINITY_DN2836_c0_g1_i7.p3 TRINITY_DN2836_c0_g1~~TRINITY_DN2836_c0_g1_i7.p3  ORF type:complete len:260 (-),score=55.59 TRINITY_DN2836_c0_g1_i7:714-1493(-)
MYLDSFAAAVPLAGVCTRLRAAVRAVFAAPTVTVMVDFPPRKPPSPLLTGCLGLAGVHLVASPFATRPPLHCPVHSSADGRPRVQGLSDAAAAAVAVGSLGACDDPETVEAVGAARAALDGLARWLVGDPAAGRPPPPLRRPCASELTVGVPASVAGELARRVPPGQARTAPTGACPAEWLLERLGGTGSAAPAGVEHLGLPYRSGEAVVGALGPLLLAATGGPRLTSLDVPAAALTPACGPPRTACGACAVCTSMPCA